MSVQVPDPSNLILRNFEAVELKKEKYGKEIRFNHQKRHIKFTSEYHEPGYLNYDQVDHVVVKFINKKMWFLVGIFTILIFIGIFILFIRAVMPKGQILIFVKNQKKPISIRIRLGELDAERITEFCKEKINITYYPPK